MKESEIEYRIFWRLKYMEKAFYFPVGDVDEAVSILMVLHRYDTFRGLDITTPGGLECKKIKEPEWESWRSEKDEDIWRYMERRYMFYLKTKGINTLPSSEFLKKLDKEEEAFKDIDFTCKCGEPGKEQFDNGLPCGIHCDKCFQEMVDECRRRSW